MKSSVVLLVTQVFFTKIFSTKIFTQVFFTKVHSLAKARKSRVVGRTGANWRADDRAGLGHRKLLRRTKKQGAGFNFEERVFWYLSETGCCLLPTVGRVWHICPAGRSTGDCDSCRLQLPVEHAGPMCRPGL